METQLRAGEPPMPSPRWVALALVALTIAAAALRWSGLDAVPPGLYRDEAYNGLDALRVLAGERPIFFAANNGREPLFIYLAAGAVALLGRSPGALRAVSALAGTLLVPTLYWLGRELRGWRVGLLTAALAVTSVWLLSMSRLALRAGLLPLVATLALAAAWRGQRLRRPGWMVLAGALFGLCAYTYLAARFVPLAVALWGLWCALDRRASLWWRGWAILAAIALLVAAPLGLYLLSQGDLLGRAGQVSVLNPAIHGGDPLGALARSLGRTARMFAYGGDFIPRHNVPWRPVFVLPLAAAFYAGAALAAWRVRRDAAARLALVWLGVLLLPTVLAEGAPHFLRAVGAVPMVFLLPAMALDWLTGRFTGRWRFAALAVTALALLCGAWSDVRDYRRHLASEAVYYQFESGATELALDINNFLGSGWQGSGLSVAERAPTAGREVWLAARLWDQWPSVRFLVEPQGQVRRLEQGAPVPGSAPTALLVILWPFDDHASVLAALPPGFAWELREGAWEQGDLEPSPRLLYVALQGRAAGGWASAPGSLWEDGIALVGAGVDAAEGVLALTLTLHWRAEGPPGEAYSASRHVLCDGLRVGQQDGPPGGGIWPAYAWRPGDVIVERRHISLDAPWDPARCQVQVGLYRWQDLTRLELRDAAGLRVKDDAVIIEANGLNRPNDTMD
jgi:4-amino-4-deoxy-L-arabinose transferase-like glycosyltransferase